MSDKTYEELLDELESYNTRVSTATDTYEESLGTIASAVTTSRLSSESATESETNAAASETNASTSETNAATSETNASASATAAALSETNASTYNSSASAYADAASQSASDAAASLASLDDQVTLASGYADNAEASATAAAESLATFVSMPEPDVFIPFNDGVELRAGYGTRNTYGNKAVDFSRASTTGNINKSGVLETVAIDEASITSGGLSVYGGYTNYFLIPTAPATQTISLSANTYTLWCIGDGTASTIYGDATESNELTFTSTGEDLVVTITGTLTLVNLINLYKTAPPIVDDTLATRAEDCVSIPMMSNMPKIGQEFTIVCECSVPFPGIETRVFDTGTFTSGFTLLRTVNGGVRWVIADGNGGYTYSNFFTYAQVDEALHTYVCRYKDGFIGFFVDGVPAGDLSASSIYYDNTLDLYFGSNDGGLNFLNSTIKNFRIYHSPLSDAQIAALGAAE